VTVTQPAADAADLSAYLAVHPAPVMAADALIRDDSGRVLIVDPSYKEGWDLPGGMVDDEEPVAALERELREELGIRGARVGRLLAVDSMPKEVYGRSQVACVYAVHPRRPLTVEELVLQREELRAAEYVPEREALRRLPKPLRRRVTAALRASLGSHTAQLRQGRPVPVDLRDHYALLPSPMMAAAALITDTGGRVLVAEHSYDHGGGSPYGLPGGMVHAQESPRRGAARELAEELGLTGVPVGRLVAVDSTPARSYGRALDVHVFTVGPLTPEQVAAIDFPDGEILAVHWLDPREALALLPAQIGNRLRYGLRALAAGTVAHLEGGLPQPGSPVGVPAARRAPFEEPCAGVAAAADRRAVRAKALTSASVLLTDPEGRVVLVRGAGGGGWSLPGVAVAGDTGESPREAAGRAVRERLGRDVPPGGLLAVDWLPGADSGCEGAHLLPETLYVYDGGVLDDAAGTAGEEGRSGCRRAVPAKELEALLPAAAAARVRECLVVRARGTGAVELVAGRPPRG
jgi:ADP-ribose pyrophosphatase YjhB (NUDIX family)